MLSIGRNKDLAHQDLWRPVPYSFADTPLDGRVIRRWNPCSTELLDHLVPMCVIASKDPAVDKQTNTKQNIKVHN